MNKIEKFLRKLDSFQRREIERLIVRLISGVWDGLDIKKLKGVSNTFRARRGDIRVIFRLEKNGTITLINISRRDDTTYN